MSADVDADVDADVEVADNKDAVRGLIWMFVIRFPASGVCIQTQLLATMQMLFILDLRVKRIIRFIIQAPRSIKTER